MATRQPHALLGAHRPGLPAMPSAAAKPAEYRSAVGGVATIFGSATKTNFNAFSIGSRWGAGIVAELGEYALYHRGGYQW